MNEKNDRLAPTIFDETTGIRYDLHGDYYFPHLLDPEQENSESIGKWGLMRQKYLQDNHPGLFSRMLLSGKLEDHLREINKQASERFDTLMTGYKQTWNITEELKAEDPMRWVGLMNNARAEAEMNVTTEIVYC